MCLLPDNCVFPLLLSHLCVIITDKHKSGVDRNKNDPVFHHRLLRDTHTAVVLREEKSPSEFCPRTGRSNAFSSFSAFLGFSISVAAFHDEERWLKWL